MRKGKAKSFVFSRQLIQPLAFWGKLLGLAIPHLCLQLPFLLPRLSYGMTTLYPPPMALGKGKLFLLHLSFQARKRSQSEAGNESWVTSTSTKCRVKREALKEREGGRRPRRTVVPVPFPEAPNGYYSHKWHQLQQKGHQDTSC